VTKARNTNSNTYRYLRAAVVLGRGRSSLIPSDICENIHMTSTLFTVYCRQLRTFVLHLTETFTPCLYILYSTEERLHFTNIHPSDTLSSLHSVLPFHLPFFTSQVSLLLHKKMSRAPLMVYLRHKSKFKI